jgi:hypothetical protein
VYELECRASGHVYIGSTSQPPNIRLGREYRDLMNALSGGGRRSDNGQFRAPNIFVEMVRQHPDSFSSLILKLCPATERFEYERLIWSDFREEGNLFPIDEPYENRGSSRHNDQAIIGRLNDWQRWLRRYCRRNGLDLPMGN